MLTLPPGAGGVVSFRLMTAIYFCAGATVTVFSTLIPSGQKCEITGPAADPRTDFAAVIARASQKVVFFGLSMLWTSIVTRPRLPATTFALAEVSARLC